MAAASSAVDVVVVSYNSAAHLPRLYASLAAQTHANWRLILWDNASEPDQRPDPANAPPGTQVVQSPENLGFAAGNNRAAALGSGPFIAFLNPDAFPEPGWLSALLAAAQRWPQAGAFGSTQINASDESQWDGLGDVLFAAGIPYRAGFGRPRTGAPPPEGETFSACAAAMLIRRQVFEAVGGFDERLFCFCEDVDLGFRLRLLRQASVQVPEAVVHHVGGASTGRRSAFADRLGVRNRLWVYAKCMPGLLFWPFLPAHLALSGLLLLSYPLTGRGFAGWRGLWEGLRGLGAIFQARAEVQRSRTAPIGEIARALAWAPWVLSTRAPVIRRRGR